MASGKTTTGATTSGKKTRTVVEYEDMTPFAQALQDWMWYENRPPIRARTELADRLRLARSTVDSWFSAKRALPQGRAWHAVQQLTGWPDAKLLQLTGYREPPQYVPDAFDFIEQWIAESKESADFKAKARTVLAEVATAYAKAMRTTPGRRPPRREKVATPSTSPTPVTTSTPAPTPAAVTPAREREKAHSGK